ncbi:alpha/beta hydrolase [Flavisphingomonas formosensis]|uniref:alpha/beta hydrolase n=1 Tax=Flavisphingomonas formosensis TaxID=861534 RepID=UPI0012F8E412|nr:hypothetical protein [Sphingomonas formosensis]
MRISVIFKWTLASLLTVSSPVIAADLPAPEGPYAVGFRHFELVADHRHGVGADRADAARVLPAYLWYPARRTAGERAAFIPGDDASIQAASIVRIFRYQPSEVALLLQGKGSAIKDALPRTGRYPLVIFNHGLLSLPTQNSTLAEELASNGYIVLSIAHPGDAVDLRLDDGRTITANFDFSGDRPLKPSSEAMTTSPDLDVATKAVDEFRENVAHTRLDERLETWRDDILFAIDAIAHGRTPASVRHILARADTANLALTGMSTGGMIAVAVCERLPSCTAAVNIDGQNFAPELFDTQVRRPLLLLQSDWTRYALFGTKTFDESFSPNDLSYQRWQEAGLSRDVVRIRIEGTRHMGLTDLPLLITGPDAAARFGDADPVQVSHAISRLTRAFLDVHLKRRSPDLMDNIAGRIAGAQLHDPAQIRSWARTHQSR